MPDTIQLIPLDAIDADALTRDRSALDEAALEELILSIRNRGLRMPVEVYPLPNAGAEGAQYGLISGWRRLTAFRREHAFLGFDRYAAIPAIVREPEDLAAALTAMVEENEIRAELSPWERGRIAVMSRDRRAFASIDEAVDTLFGATSRQKRSKLRSVAHVVEELEGRLVEPEALSLNQILRLSYALQRGFGDLICTAIKQSRPTGASGLWDLLQPILAEAETVETPGSAVPRSDRPRRTAQPRSGLTIRREVTRDGYLLRFTGREATSDLIDLVFSHIENLLGPA